MKITETILRDAHQSQAATRMTMEDMLPALEMLDKIPYHSLEVWGGATFDACLRFLNEDPWERLRTFRKAMPNSKLQMLFRGQNILGYKHYADDVVDKFVELSLKNGIDIIRIFDALNDPRNLKTAIKSTNEHSKRMGRGLCEAAISYTISPVHNNQYFVDLACELEEMGADIICIKDMANILLPYTAYDLISAMKKKLKVPVHLHTHNTAGTGDMVYIKAVEAGCDIVDCALSPFGNGTSQPATEPLVASLKGTKFDTGINLSDLVPIVNHFKKVADKMTESGLINQAVHKIDINTLEYQVPGGMLSNLISQLKQANALDKYMDVLKEVPKVREDFGYPPLVTPTSQIVGTQAVLNVLSGERYKQVTKESKGLLKGEYGKVLGKPNPEVVKKVVGDEKIITCRPADLLKPELDTYRAQIGEYYQKEEDVLSYALFPQVATNFFKYRQAQQQGIDKNIFDKDGVHPV